MVWLLLACSPELESLQRDFEAQQQRSFLDCGELVLEQCPGAQPPAEIQCVEQALAQGEPMRVVLRSEELALAAYWLGLLQQDNDRLVQLQRTQTQRWRTDCADLGEWQENPRNGCYGLSIVGPCEQHPL